MRTLSGLATILILLATACSDGTSPLSGRDATAADAPIAASPDAHANDAGGGNADAETMPAMDAAQNDAMGARDAIASADDAAATNADAMPANDDAAAVNDDAARANDDAAPANDDAAPANDDATPANDDAAAVNDDAAAVNDDAGPPCVTVTVDQCNSGRTIANWCPAGRHVTTLTRCDNVTIPLPDQQYAQHPLSYCPDPGCPIDGAHVVFQAIECCY